MLHSLLKNLVKSGYLTISVADEPPRSYGVPGALPDVMVCVEDETTARKLAICPDLYLGEAYMEGKLTVRSGTIRDLLELCGANCAGREFPEMLPAWIQSLSERAWFKESNRRLASRANVAHHYDLSPELYRAFLDADMQYSCAYFDDGEADLEHAQRRKKEHIARKLLLRPGLRVLDIGCGWGGLALGLAQHEDVRVHGISLSQEQLRVCKARAEAAGLADRVTFELRDYRDLDQTYDRIVSVGMFEHVGRPNYGAFFNQIERHLDAKGVALVHSIGRASGPSTTSRWIQKYIFPGGYAPALSEVLPHIERSGLWVADLEVLRLHYARTLQLWQDRFHTHLIELPMDLDERFVRMWDFYLAASEMSFRHHGFMVFQAQLTRDPAAVPLTRDYLYRPSEQPIADHERWMVAGSRATNDADDRQLVTAD